MRALPLFIPVSDRTMARPVARLAGAAVAVAGLALAACSTPKVLPERTLVGAPPVSTAVENERHLVVLQAPNAGWTIAQDRTAKADGATRVLLTIRRPDPTFLYAQQIVEKRLLTDVPATTPIELFARVVESHERSPKADYERVVPTDAE